MQKHIFSKFYGKVGRKVDKGKKGFAVSFIWKNYFENSWP